MKELKLPEMIDGHIHVQKVSETYTLREELNKIHVAQAGIACRNEGEITNSNPAGFVLKSRDPGRFFILAGLEHSGLLYNAKKALSPVDQMKVLQNIGIDGVKILASKPSERKRLGKALDGPYFEGFFAECESKEVPILWHVADPEEFWSRDKIPAWAKSQGWGYNESYSSREELYEEVENVLKRHPALNVVFPHFYFLSKDLKRAKKLLLDFPRVNLDISPGIELFYNLSSQKKAAKDFFYEFSDRILYGTDIISSFSSKEIEARAKFIYRFLFNDDEFHIPDYSDNLLGKPEDGLISGLNLPGGIINSIILYNFQKIFGRLPCVMDTGAAREECVRLHEIEKEVNPEFKGETEAYKAAMKLGSITIEGF